MNEWICELSNLYHASLNMSHNDRMKKYNFKDSKMKNCVMSHTQQIEENHIWYYFYLIHHHRASTSYKTISYAFSSDCKNLKFLWEKDCVCGMNDNCFTVLPPHYAWHCACKNNLKPRNMKSDNFATLQHSPFRISSTQLPGCDHVIFGSVLSLHTVCKPWIVINVWATDSSL